MKKLLLLFLTLFVSTDILIAQKESWNWYFGNHAALNFSTGTPVPLLNSALYGLEGTASISDSSGNLLFYTNGNVVYDSTHNLMQLGTGLSGNNSSTQSALIVKKPGSDSLYFLFTVDYGYLLRGST